MENFYNIHNSSYLWNTDMNRRIQLMNTQIESPYALKGRSSPFEYYKCDNAENVDPQVLMSFGSGSSSSGDNFSSPSALNRVRYRGGYEHSPLSLVESSGNSSGALARKSSAGFVNTPVNMEDDVLVMDEVFVMNALGGSSKYGKDTSGSSASSGQSYKMDVGKETSGSSASSGPSNKMVVCNSWAETGSCRFGSSCQFSHSKEDQGLTRLSNKGKPEMEICFPRSPFTNSSASSFKGYNSRPTISRGAVVYGRSPQGSIKVGNLHGSPSDGSGSNASCRSTPSVDSHSPATLLDWIPQDDGIDARPPGAQNPSRNEVVSYINNILYAPSNKKRLPVFLSFCPDAPRCSS